MTEPIKQHALTAADERAHGGKICHVTAREEQRPFASGEVGEFLFQLRMLGAVPGDQVRGAAARPHACRAVTHRAHERRMACEAEVIIAAEVDKRAPVLHAQHPIVRSREAPDRHAPAPKLRSVELGERGCERRYTAFARERLHGHFRARRRRRRPRHARGARRPPVPPRPQDPGAQTAAGRAPRRGCRW